MPLPQNKPQGTPPVDQLRSAEEALTVLRKALHPLGDDDWTRQTPCAKYDIARLTDHLMTSITGLGGAGGAEFPARNSTDSVERQVILAARPALDAWHRRGMAGTVTVGPFDATRRR